MKFHFLNCFFVDIRRFGHISVLYASTYGQSNAHINSTNRDPCRMRANRMQKTEIFLVQKLTDTKRTICREMGSSLQSVAHRMSSKNVKEGAVLEQTI